MYNVLEYIFASVVFFSVSFTKVAADENGAGSKNVLNLPDGYNFFEIPFQPAVNNYSPPINVTFSVRVERIRKIDEVNNELTLDMEIILGWTDWKILAHRKNFTASQVVDYIKSGQHHLETTQKSRKMITLNNPAYLKAIWTPNLYIYDLVEKSNPRLMSDLITLKYDPDGGYITYATRAILKFSYPMEFRYYPMDTHKFNFKIRGFSYNKKLLNLIWEKPPRLNDRDQANFDLQLSSFAQTSVAIHGENFNLLTFTLMSRRKLSYHVIQTYIPSYLLILITWLSFFIPQNMVEVRVGICMTTVLTLTAMQDRQGAPRSAYVKALEIFMVCSIFSVFLILLQFALLIWLNHMKSKLEKKLSEISVMAPAYTSASADSDKRWEMKWGNESPSKHGKKLREHVKHEISKELGKIKKSTWIIEKIAFPSFFSGFLLFNAAYWSWLTVSSEFMAWPETNGTLNI